MTPIVDTPFLKRISEALNRSGRTRRRKKPVPNAANERALREAGLSEATIQILVEGDRHEREFVSAARDLPTLRVDTLPEHIDRALVQFQEAVTSDVSAASTTSLPVDWTESSTGTLTSKRAPGHRIMVDGQDWRHHGPDGRIVRRGTGAASLAEYAKTIRGDTGDMGNANAAEGLDAILGRIRGTLRPEGEVKAHRLIEAIRESAGRTASPSGDLHARLRAAATRSR